MTLFSLFGLTVMLMKEKVVKLCLVEWILVTTRVTTHMSQSPIRDIARLVLFVVLSSNFFDIWCKYVYFLGAV
jgi:hypothetical protein